MIAWAVGAPSAARACYGAGFEGAPVDANLGVLAWIAIGLIAGWLAAKITNAPRGLLRNLVVGLLGAMLGGFLFGRLGLNVMPDFWGALITAVVGAVVLLFLLQVVRRA
jgi:uncharacterized membrane protein YeaQ/YmgE (transglycosylase-associated protein family)